MSQTSYNKQTTTLLVIDPCNDFISEGGKVWDRLKAAWDPSAHRHRPHCAPCVEATVRFAAELGHEVTVNLL